MWPHAGPELQTKVVFLVPLLLLASRSEHQTCSALHGATWGPTSGTATSSAFKARVIAKKNLLESHTHTHFQSLLRGVTCLTGSTGPQASDDQVVRVC